MQAYQSNQSMWEEGESCHSWLLIFRQLSSGKKKESLNGSILFNQQVCDQPQRWWLFYSLYSLLSSQAHRLWRDLRDGPYRCCWHKSEYTVWWDKWHTFATLTSIFLLFDFFLFNLFKLERTIYQENQVNQATKVYLFVYFLHLLLHRYILASATSLRP